MNPGWLFIFAWLICFFPPTVLQLLKFFRKKSWHPDPMRRLPML